VNVAKYLHQAIQFRTIHSCCKLNFSLQTIKNFQSQFLRQVHSANFIWKFMHDDDDDDSKILHNLPHSPCHFLYLLYH